MLENQQILQLINLLIIQQGEILSAGRVDIINPDLTLVVNNALGKVESVVGTTLQAKTLVDEGSISTKGDFGY